MLAYGFQLVNADRREMNIFGVNGSKRENFTAVAHKQHGRACR
jgi:hypothetical protein